MFFDLDTWRSTHRHSSYSLSLYLSTPYSFLYKRRKEIRIDLTDVFLSTPVKGFTEKKFSSKHYHDIREVCHFDTFLT